MRLTNSAKTRRGLSHLIAAIERERSGSVGLRFWLEIETHGGKSADPTKEAEAEQALKWLKQQAQVQEVEIKPVQEIVE